MILQIVVLLVVVQNSSPDNFTIVNEVNRLNCTQHSRTDLLSITGKKLIAYEDFKHASGLLRNYVCRTNTLEETTDFHGIRENETARLLIICDDTSTSSVDVLKSGSLSRLTNLAELGFFNCQFNERTNVGEWLGNRQITHLYVQASGTKFGEHLYDRPNLDSVDLSQNGLATLPSALICSWTSLMTLLLHHNNISDLTFLYQPCNVTSSSANPLPLYTLQKMEYLDVSYNQLTTLDQELLTSFPFLHYLYLSNNHIHTINVQPLTGPSSKISFLWKLDLSYNQLQQFQMCEGIPYITQLDLSGNPIQCQNNSLLLEKCTRLLFFILDKTTGDPCPTIWISITNIPKVSQISMVSNHLKHLDLGQIPQKATIVIVNDNSINTLNDVYNKSSHLALEELIANHNELMELKGFIFPSTLRAVQLSFNRITFIAPDIFRNCSKLSNIRLNNNKLTDIKAVFVDLPNLVDLYLQENNIVRFDYSMVPVSLLYLNLSLNSISELTDDDEFSERITLRYLDVSYNHLMTVTKESIASSLSIINLNSCEVDSSHADLSMPQNHLFHMVLDNTTIYNARLQDLNCTVKRRFDFVEETNCEHELYSCSCTCSANDVCCKTYNSTSRFLSGHFNLNLDARKTMYCLVEIRCFDLCGRMTFHENSNHYLPLHKVHCSKTIDFSSFISQRSTLYGNQHFLKQKGLILSHMNISALSSGAFTDFEELIILNLDNNFLTKIYGPEFKGLNNLAKLYLNENLLTHVDDFAFHDLKNLNILHLEYNFLKHVTRKTLMNLVNLRRLYINNNHLHVLYDNNFANLRALEQLHLSHNQIETIMMSTFLGLIKLTELRLTNNKIATIEDYSFAKLVHLKTLYLDENRIQVLSQFSFYNMISLKTLNLQSNNIGTIHTEAFAALLKMSHLFLNDNSLKSWFLILPPHLANLTLSHNKFPCDCKSVFILQEQLSKVSLTVNTDADKIRCRVQNSYLPHISIQNMTEEDCYNGTVTVVQETQRGFVLAVSIAPTVVLILLLCFISALYVYRLEVQVLLYSKFNVRLWGNKSSDDDTKFYHAFLSYNSVDRIFIAEQLLPKLEERFTVCVHERDFPVGSYIADTIADVVEKSCRTLVILSPGFLQSEWCLLEFKYAHYQGLKDKCCRLIVIVYKDVDHKQLNSEIRAYLRTNTYLRWGDPLFWEKLMYVMPDMKRFSSRTSHSIKYKERQIYALP